jgi:hypothetical protein
MSVSLLSSLQPVAKMDAIVAGIGKDVQLVVCSFLTCTDLNSVANANGGTGTDVLCGLCSQCAGAEPPSGQRCCRVHSGAIGDECDDDVGAAANEGDGDDVGGDASDCDISGAPAKRVKISSSTSTTSSTSASSSLSASTSLTAAAAADVVSDAASSFFCLAKSVLNESVFTPCRGVCAGDGCGAVGCAAHFRQCQGWISTYVKCENVVCDDCSSTCMGCETDRNLCWGPGGVYVVDESPAGDVAYFCTKQCCAECAMCEGPVCSLHSTRCDECGESVCHMRSAAGDGADSFSHGCVHAQPQESAFTCTDCNRSLCGDCGDAQGFSYCVPCNAASCGRCAHQHEEH